MRGSFVYSYVPSVDPERLLLQGQIVYLDYVCSICNRSLHDQYRLSIACFLRHKLSGNLLKQFPKLFQPLITCLVISRYIHLTTGASEEKRGSFAYSYVPNVDPERLLLQGQVRNRGRIAEIRVRGNTNYLFIQASTLRAICSPS